MELARIVNLAVAGEQEHPVLQCVDTLKVFEFSNIKHTIDGQVNTDETLTDGDLSSFVIQRILNNGHTVNITYNENDEVTLHF
jgi:hypothetical protein